MAPIVKLYAKKPSAYKTGYKKTKKIVKKVLRNELENKYHERQDITNSMNDTTTNLYNFSIITQGLGDLSVRTGDVITPVSWEFHYRVRNIAANVANQVYRIMLFTWFDSTTPTIAQILNYGGSVTNYLFSPLRHDQRHRFRILYDSKAKFLPLESVAYVPIVHKKGKLSAKMEFAGGSSTCTHAIWCLFFSDYPSAGINDPIFDSSFRFTYLDG